MPFQFPTAVADVFQVTVRQEMFGQILMNTFHYVIDSRMGTPFVEDVYNALGAHFTDVGGIVDELAACWPVNNVGKRVDVQRIFSTLTPPRIAALQIVINEPGVRSSAWVSNLAGVIERRGDIASRGDVGTLHVVIPGDGLTVVNGLLSQAMKNDLDALANSLLLPVDVGPGQALLKPCLYHRLSPGVPSIITQALTQPTSRVMRRRTVGRGI